MLPEITRYETAKLHFLLSVMVIVLGVSLARLWCLVVWSNTRRCQSLGRAPPPTPSSVHTVPMSEDSTQDNPCGRVKMETAGVGSLLERGACGV